MSDARLRDLVKVAREDDERTRSLESRASEGVPAEGDEEAFVRAVLAKGSEEALVTAALYADAAPPSSTAVLTSVSSMPAARPPSAAVPPSPASSSRGRRSVAPPPKRRRLWVPLAGIGLALAAALIFAIRPRSSFDPLPGYEAALSGGDAPERAEPSTSTVVTHGAAIVLVARPRDRVEGPIEARAFAGCDGMMTRLDRPVVIASTGAARIEGMPEALFGNEAVGPCSLAIAIARPGALPERFEDAAASATTVRVDVLVRR